MNLLSIGISDSVITVAEQMLCVDLCDAEPGFTHGYAYDPSEDIGRERAGGAAIPARQCV